MKEYNFYEALKMAYEGKKMLKKNAFVYMCFSGNLEFRDFRNNALCGIQKIDKSDFTHLWVEVIEKSPQQIEIEEIEKRQRELAEEQRQLADRIAQLKR